MKLFKTLKVNVNGLILVILIPILFILIIIMGWVSYSETNKNILNGFDQKLIGVSSTTGAFIDGDEHEELAEAKKIKAMAFTQGNELFAVDTLNRFLSIDPEEGDGTVLFQLDHNINDLTYNSNLKLFFATNENEVLTINPQNKEVLVYHVTDFPIYGIAYNKKKKLLYLSHANGILKLDEEKSAEELYKSSKHFKALTFNEERELLYALEDVSDHLFGIDINTLEQQQLIYENFPPSTTYLRAISYKNNKLYGGSYHLVEYDLNNSTSTHEDFNRGYRNENSDIYKKYIAPMNEIKIDTGLTYLYTQNLLYNSSDANCFYILDVHDGSEYTPIGSEDVMDTETLIGAENVMLRNQVYVSGVQRWEQWGLLKVSFAPITNQSGVVKAIAGADVDISIINKKIKEALLETLAIGALFIIISIFIAVSISKKIIEPIQKLKYAALRIAAGRYGDEISIHNPKELSTLSNTFNTMDNKLKDTISSIINYDSDFFTIRKEQNIKRVLNQQYKINHENLRILSSESTNSIDSVLLHDDILYFWFSSRSSDNAILNIKEKGIIATTLSKLIGKVDNPMQELQSLFKNIDQFGYIDLKQEMIYLHESSNDLKVLTLTSDDKFELMTLKPGSTKRSQNMVFAQEKILKKITSEQISNLLNAKQSGISLEQFSIVFALVQRDVS